MSVPAGVPAGPPPPESLSKVLKESEHVKDLVKESAEDLAVVNQALKQEVQGASPQTAVAEALEQSEAVEKKVEQASEKLTALSHALKGEVRDRHLLDHQLAAVREQEEAARHASFHDVLTGLPNRALFDDRLGHAIAQARRRGSSLAVMFLDLDGFKRFNDSYGHDVGDFVLRAISQRLKASTREGDTVSRTGGDEFLYLLTEVEDEQATERIAAKLIQLLQEPLETTVRGQVLSLGVKASVGISFHPKHGATANTLIIAADLAMYKAKQSGCGYAFAA